MKLLRVLAFSFVTSLAAVSVPAAHAGDDFADWDCDALWEQRNQIYKDNGYCFHTARAIKHFGNADCEHDREGDVPLSKSDRSIVRRIKAAERANGC